MIEEHLTKAVVTAIRLLEHSTADEVDRDIAMRGLENIASDLSDMNAEERAEFRRILARLAEQEPEDAAYLETLPGHLGI